MICSLVTVCLDWNWSNRNPPTIFSFPEKTRRNATTNHPTNIEEREPRGASQRARKEAKAANVAKVRARAQSPQREVVTSIVPVTARPLLTPIIPSRGQVPAMVIIQVRAQATAVVRIRTLMVATTMASILTEEAIPPAAPTKEAMASILAEETMARIPTEEASHRRPRRRRHSHRRPQRRRQWRVSTEETIQPRRNPANGGSNPTGGPDGGGDGEYPDGGNNSENPNGGSNPTGGPDGGGNGENTDVGSTPDIPEGGGGNGEGTVTTDNGDGDGTVTTDNGDGNNGNGGTGDGSDGNDSGTPTSGGAINCDAIREGTGPMWGPQENLNGELQAVYYPTAVEETEVMAFIYNVMNNTVRIWMAGCDLASRRACRTGIKCNHL